MDRLEYFKNLLKKAPDNPIETLQEDIQKVTMHNHPSMAEEFRRWTEQLRHLQFF